MAWHLITQGDDQNSNYMEFLLDSESDINSPPTSIYSYALSSIAHTPGFTKVWECDASGNWIEIEGSGSGANTSMIAPQYSDLTFPVVNGQHCIHDNGYYEANVDIPTAEDWTPGHWTSLTVGEEASLLKNDIAGQTVIDDLLIGEIPGTTQTVTFDANDNPSTITHSKNGTTVRTDTFTWGTNTVEEVRVLSSGKQITITTDLTTLQSVISAITEVA